LNKTKQQHPEDHQQMVLLDVQHEKLKGKKEYNPF
jgi:hypothetical protein